MAYTAADVKNLREMTGVGMMDCKKALEASDGDIEKAVEYLREKGLATAQKKAGRVAAEGVSVTYVGDDGTAAIVEVNIETDFAAKNEEFVKFANAAAELVAKFNPKDVEELMGIKYPGTDMTLEDMRKEKVMVIGENIQVRRFARYDTGLTVSYIHMGGKIGVLVNMDVSDNIKNAAEVTELGKDLAMQVAAMRPLYRDKTDVPEEVIEKEREINFIAAKQDPKNEGKPDNIIEKMVSGRIAKYFNEVCLLQQEFVKGDKVSVEKHVAEVGKSLGGKISIASFTRFETGEGIEKKADNFAEEVASMIK